MRVLADASYPSYIDRVPNQDGITVDRIEGALTDRQLIDYAIDHSYAAVVLLDAEVVAQGSILDYARSKRMTLICSSTDDPFEAEANLRRWLRTLPEKVRNNRGSLMWLRRDGLRPDQS